VTPTSSYEQRKYRHTLEYLPERTGRTLELGCSVGVFTGARRKEKKAEKKNQKQQTS